MSADTLRRAASLMRERAEATTPDAAWTEGHYWIASYDMSGDPVQEEIGGMGGSGDAAHYSSWHPAVALAVAALLDGARCGLHCDPDGMREPYCSACDDSTYDHECPGREPCKHTAPYRRALAVARAYLGEAS